MYLNIISKICFENNILVAKVFHGFNLRVFQKLFINHFTYVIVFMDDLFKKDQTILILNSQLYKQTIQSYSQLVEQFEQNNVNEMEQQLIIIFGFNMLILKFIDEKFLDNNDEFFDLSINILLQNLIVNKVLPFLTDENNYNPNLKDFILIDKPVRFIYEYYNNYQKLTTMESRQVVLEIMFTFLKIFNTASIRLYDSTSFVLL